MNTRFKLSVSLFVAMAAVCVLSLPPSLAAAAPDGAADRTAPPKIEFRFDKDADPIPAAQTGAVDPQAFSRLSIRLYGGFSRIAAGDLNEGADGFFELFAAYAALGLGTSTGGYNPLHAGYNFGADFIYQISPSIGVGLGVGYLRSSRDSLMTISSETVAFNLSGRPTLSAVPIRLGVFLSVPVAAKINFTADAGAALYAGLKLEATQRLELDATNWTVMSVSGSRTSFANLGFQGSLGVEYKLSPQMGFFVEAVGRYARFKNLDAVTGTTETSDGGSETLSGKLYIDTVTSTDPALTYSAFTIEETPPVDTATDTFREPKIDLSGFSLQAGIRIRF